MNYAVVFMWICISLFLGYRLEEYKGAIEKASKSLVSCKLENAAMEREVTVLKQVIGVRDGR